MSARAINYSGDQQEPFSNHSAVELARDFFIVDTWYVRIAFDHRVPGITSRINQTNMLDTERSQSVKATILARDIMPISSNAWHF